MDRGKPVLHMQNCLRKLSYYYPIFRVIPTGYFDDKTRQAVLDFEKYFGLMLTGQIDNNLYEKINEEYQRVVDKEQNIKDNFSYSSGDSGEEVGLFQVLSNFLALQFKNISRLDITYIMDENTTENVKKIQNILNMKEDGILHKKVIMGVISIIKA